MARCRSTSRNASTLEREVAMLDAVRNALTGADFDGALQLIAEYRRQFPRGELARDADVFEVEAFARRGDRARARRAAQRFLREYPRDPTRADSEPSLTSSRSRRTARSGR
jgi:outer membrane protein assembly factor BamD (BamD/ComL family)